MVKVGLRAQNMPQDEEKMVLLSFVRKYFGSLTPEMVSEAFDLAITDKLEIDPKQVSCYENFTCEYVGRILTAYIKYLKFSGRLKSQLDKERQFVPPENQKLLAMPKMEDQEKIDLSFDMWKSTGNFIYIDENVFLILEKSGLIKLTNEEKKPFMSAAISYMKSMEDGKPNFFGNHDPKRYQQIYARKLAAESYFKTLI